MTLLEECFPLGTLTYNLNATALNTFSSRSDLQDCLATRLPTSEWLSLNPGPSNSFPSQSLLSCMENSSSKPFQISDLVFLLENSYILVTFKVASIVPENHSETQIILRVYIVPQDVPGIRGRLQRRSVHKVIKPALQILPDLMDKVCRIESNWRGIPQDRAKEMPETPLPLIATPVAESNHSLLDIFNNLSSSYLGDPVALGERFLRTTLYKYQREAVSVMQDMEKANFVSDPLFVPVVGMDGTAAYLQPATLELRKEQPIIYRGRGGFLSEELGSGKTLMILSLILSDLNSLPPPPDSHSTQSGVLTPLSLRTFPFQYHQSFRDLLMLKSSVRHRPSNGNYLPSLVELCLDTMCISREGYDLQQDLNLSSSIRKTENPRTVEEQLEFSSLLDPFLHNTPFFIQSSGATMIENKKYRSRQPTGEMPRIVFLSHATVIVVPVNLISQWEGQILLHCSRALRVFVVKGDVKLPSTQQLAIGYDIILIASTWLSNQPKRPGRSSELQPGYTCKCPEYSATVKVPLCTCHMMAPHVSPLLQIYFKRLVRDEGHNAFFQFSNLNLYCTEIQAHSRWIVTGTPTSNLLGLNLGAEHKHSSNSRNGTVNSSSDANISRADLLVAFEQKKANPCVAGVGDTGWDFQEQPQSGSDIPDLRHRTRIWTDDEREDLKILGVMLGGFLAVERFSNSDHFTKQIIDPLFPQVPANDAQKKSWTRGPPISGAIQVIRQIMHMYMVRHPAKDIEVDHPLPPMSQEVILLDLHPFAALTFNVMQSVIAVNAVDSAMTDKDYFFHANNKAALLEVTDNLSQALFWHRDETYFNVALPEKLQIAKEAIGHAKERQRSDSDIRLMEESFLQLDLACNNATFQMMHALHEVPYEFTGIAATLTTVLDSVASVNGNVPTSQATIPVEANSLCLMTPSHALEYRDLIERRPLVSSEDLVELARLVQDDERARNAVEATKKQASKKKLSKSAVDVASAEELARRTKQHENAIEDKRKEYEIAQKRRSELTGKTSDKAAAGDPHDMATAVSDARRQFLKSSLLGSARILRTLSSKLTYILKEVLEFSAKEKFLIFSKQPLNLVHIAEGLDLLGVKYLDYRSRSSKEQNLNSRNLMTFETSDVFRVFLMELQHGARGLNIISASRIIFCEPVWKSDVESQAIKRAHRIGQTRPVTVKTLAIKSTFEEFMLERRRELKDSDAGNLPKQMAQESGMRHYLKNPTFVKPGDEDVAKLDIPLLRIPETVTAISQQDDNRGTNSGVRVEIIEKGNEKCPKRRKEEEEEESVEISPVSSRKKVRFV